jgi:hypothetical protein
VGVAQDESVTRASAGVFYTLHRCLAPYCNAYFLREVNGREAHSIVTEVSFSGLADETIADIAEAPSGDVIVRGTFLAPTLAGGGRRFAVTEAYRGLPGIQPLASDLFWEAPERRPPIVCIAAPCNNIIADALNTDQSKPFTSLWLEHALAPMVDAVWIEHQILQNGALISGHFRDGDRRPGGRDLVMEVSQVYLRLSVERPLCVVLPHRVCLDHLRATYTRDVNRCLAFDTCADNSQCQYWFPPKCADGYVRKEWQIAGAPCTEYVCDPAFAH